MTQKIVELRITGFVQGVGFRYGAEEKANELGLVLHSAKNQADGSVHFVLEGDGEGLQKFIAWARVGPSPARVENVNVAWR